MGFSGANAVIEIDVEMDVEMDVEIETKMLAICS